MSASGSHADDCSAILAYDDDLEDNTVVLAAKTMPRGVGKVSKGVVMTSEPRHTYRPAANVHMVLPSEEGQEQLGSQAASIQDGQDYAEAEAAVPYAAETRRKNSRKGLIAAAIVIAAAAALGGWYLSLASVQSPGPVIAEEDPGASGDAGSEDADSQDGTVPFEDSKPAEDSAPQDAAADDGSSSDASASTPSESEPAAPASESASADPAPSPQQPASGSASTGTSASSTSSQKSVWVVDVPGHYETKTREVPFYEQQPVYKDVTIYICDDGFESEDYEAAQAHQKEIGGDAELQTRNKKVETGTQQVQNGTTTEEYQEWVPEQGHWS